MFGWGFSQPCLITGGYCMIYFVLMDCFLPEWLHHLNLPHVFIGIFIIGNWWDVATGHLIFPQIEIIGHWIEIIGHWNAVEKQLLPPLSQHVPTYFNYFSCFPTIVQLVPTIISSPTIVHHPFRFQHCSSTSYDFPTIFPLVPPFSPSFFKLPIIFPFSRFFQHFRRFFQHFPKFCPGFPRDVRPFPFRSRSNKTLAGGGGRGVVGAALRESSAAAAAGTAAKPRQGGHFWWGVRDWYRSD